jgi:hypothetical protein
MLQLYDLPTNPFHPAKELPTSYSVVPNLPAGLNLDSSNGTIAGTPTAVTPRTTYTVTASNSAGSTTFNLVVTVNPAAPTGLSYTTPTTAAVGIPVSLTSSVTGTVTAYSVSPNLPAGLSLDPTSGVISGSPTAAAAHANYTVTASNVTGKTSAVLSLEVDSGPTVLLTVTTIPSTGLSYYWKTTDGQLLGNTTGAQASWMLPQGPGFHFAYVLVSDNNGNCSEARVAVNSDSFGAPSVNPNAVPIAKPIYSIVGGCPALHNPFYYLPAATQTPPTTSMITSISATFGGSAVGSFQAVFPSVLVPSEPSNVYLAADQFLTALGEDTAQSGCQYYIAIGAAGGCDSARNITSGALTLAQWKAQSNIDGPDTNSVAPTYYVNVVDLNLTREHHSLLFSDSSGQPALAAYVCNHAPPSGGPVNLPASTITPAQQTAVNTAVANAVAGQALVACVAMDFTLVQGNKVVRFLIFGPSGELLTSANLDGRGEKYVPHVCIACHGGTTSKTYSGPNVQAYFLPYDIDNFAFSTQSNLTEAAQDAQFHQLNSNVNSAPAGNETAPPITTATADLFNGWYGNGEDFGYVPWTPDVLVPPLLTTNTVYTDVVARSCRTCHTAIPSFNWDALGPQITVNLAYPNVCTFTPPVMPNSLVAFNRFWDSPANNAISSSIPNQVTEFLALYNFYNMTTPGTCTIPTPTSSIAHPSQTAHKTRTR